MRCGTCPVMLAELGWVPSIAETADVGVAAPTECQSHHEAHRRVYGREPQAPR